MRIRRRAFLAGLGVAGALALGGPGVAPVAQRADAPVAQRADAPVAQRADAPVSPAAAAEGAAGGVGAEPDPTGGSYLARLIEDVPGADGHRYRTTDSAGSGMDTAKIIDNPAGGYLAVYHWANAVRLATSSDILHWRFTTVLDPHGTQPTIIATSDGGFVVAHEASDGQHGGQIRLLHYADLDALYAARADRRYTARQSLTRCSEGTPNIFSVKLDPDIDHSVIDLGLHYHHNCDTDREATARLVNFTGWQAAPRPVTDVAVVKAAALVGRKIGGNIGDRDSFTYGRRLYTINEAQYVKGDFGTWRPYLYDYQTGRAEQLHVRTHRGSRSFANPTLTRVRAPGGDPAIVVTMYVPAEGAVPGEAGELVYYTTPR